MTNEKAGGSRPEKSAWELKTDQERRAIETIKDMYAFQDQDAVKSMKEFSVVEDYFKDLQGKMAEIKKTKEELEKAITVGDHQAEDLDMTVKFLALADKARNFASSSMEPTTPKRVKIEQLALERASDVAGKVESAERVISVLGGESLENMAVPPAEKFVLSEAEMLAQDKEISSSVLSLQSEVQSAVERLKALGPELKKIAESKMLPAAEKEEKLKQYEEQFKEYEKLRKDLLAMLATATE
jgi:hypothetical protein